MTKLKTIQVSEEDLLKIKKLAEELSEEHGIKFSLRQALMWLVNKQ